MIKHARSSYVFLNFSVNRVCWASWGGIRYDQISQKSNTSPPKFEIEKWTQIHVSASGFGSYKDDGELESRNIDLYRPGVDILAKTDEQSKNRRPEISK